MKVEVLGTCCSNCEALVEICKQAVAKIGGFHSVEKVEDIVKIMEYGVISTPALVIDGVVKSTGKLLTLQEVLKFMEEK